MNRLLKKLRRTFQGRKNMQSISSNRLCVEMLEPRVLLSADPIYSYADPEGVTEWFTNAIAQPNLDQLGYEISGIRQSFAGSNFFGSARVKAETNATKPYVDYLLDQLSYYQFEEWYNTATRIPYYIYNTTYIDEYFQEAVASPMWDYFPPFDGVFGNQTSSYYIEEYVSGNLVSELALWQDMTNDILPHSLPDLKVTIVEAPVTAKEGVSISLSGSIVNDGECDAEAFVCQYFLSLVTDPTAVIFLEEPFVINSIAGGQSITDTRSVLIPMGDAGNYYVGLYANLGTVVPEDNITNNFAIAAIPTLIDPLPDFAVVDIWTTTQDRDEKITTAKTGDTVEFHVWIERQDLSEMPEAALKVYASTDLFFDNSDILLDILSTRQLFTFSDNTGAIWHLGADSLNELVPGAYYLVANLDPDNAVEESNENNNIFVSTTVFTVTHETTPPTTPVLLELVTDSGLSSSDNITNVTSPTFTWEAAIDPGDNSTGVAGYQWRVGGGNWSDWQINLGVTVDALSDGTHTFYVRAKDYAENIGTEAALEFVIDTIGPTIMAASPLGQLDETFSYLDVTFSEPVDVPALSRVGVEVFGPEGLFYSDSFQPLTANSCRINFPEQEAGGDYRITMGPEVIDLAGNPMEHKFEGEIILPVKVTLGGASGNTVSFRDADGSNVRVLSIGGQAVVMFAGTNLSETAIYGIPTVIGDNIEIKSIDTVCQGNPGMLMITSAGGDGQADLGEINGESLSMIIAQNVNLWGDITMTGSLGMMMVGDIADTVTITTGQSGNGLMVIAGDVGADFDIAGPVNMFMCDSFSSGSLSADKIAMVMPRTGDLGADLTARNGDIGTVIASGAITGQLSASGNINMLMSQKGGLTGTVRAGNNIGMLMVNDDVSGRVSAMGKINMLMAMGSDITGSIRAGTEIGVLMADNLDNALLSAGGNIRMISIRRDIIDSYILGGYDVGTDCAFDIQEPGGGDLLNNGNIGLVMAGGSFKRSYIGAGVLPSSTLTGSLPNVGLPATGVGGNIQLVTFGSIDTNAQDDYGVFYSMSRGSVLIGGRLVDDTLDDYFRVKMVS